MQFGEVKKTIPLLVVAVCAIGFAVWRVLPSGGAPKAMRQANANPAMGSTVVAVSLDQLRVDPFSNPKLVQKPPDHSTSEPTSGGKEPVNPLPGVFHPDGAEIVKDPPLTWPNPLSPGQSPGQNPGPGQGPIQVEKVTEITLKAIVTVTQRLAYLSIDGQEPRPFRAGDLVKDDIQIAFVNDDSVILKNKKSTVTLKVGQQGDFK